MNMKEQFIGEKGDTLKQKGEKLSIEQQFEDSSDLQKKAFEAFVGSADKLHITSPEETQTRLGRLLKERHPGVEDADVPHDLDTWKKKVDSDTDPLYKEVYTSVMSTTGTTEISEEKFTGADIDTDLAGTEVTLRSIEVPAYARVVDTSKNLANDKRGGEPGEYYVPLDAIKPGMKPHDAIAAAAGYFELGQKSKYGKQDNGAYPRDAAYTQRMVGHEDFDPAKRINGVVVEMQGAGRMERVPQLFPTKEAAIAHLKQMKEQAREARGVVTAEAADAAEAARIMAALKE